MRYVHAVKAAITLAAGLAITFSQSHDAAVGMLVLGIFGFAYAILTTVFALRFEASRYLREELAPAITSATVATFALLNQQAGVGAFTAMVAIWALVLAGNEAIIGWQARPSGLKSREHLLTAGLAFLLGALFLIAPMDAVSSVGFFGAYLVLSSVHLGISAFSVKP